jgi:excinuclease ABC subunit C
MATDRISQEIRQFVQAHPHGWIHDEWLGFLFHLSQNGVNTENEGAIGLALERERLTHTLGNMDLKGLGPKRREAIAARFGTLWNLMEASAEEIAQVPGVPRSLADQISEVLQ